MNYYNELLKRLTKDEILSLLDIIKSTEKTLNNTTIGLKRAINTNLNLTLNQDMVNDLLAVLVDFRLVMRSDNKRYYVDNSSVKIWKDYNYNINFYRHYDSDLKKVKFNALGINLDVPCFKQLDNGLIDDETNQEDIQDDQIY